MIDFWGPILSALAQFVPWVIAGLAVLGFGVARKRAGKKEARMETALEAAERYAKQRKAMDDAEAAMGDDPAVLRDRLRNRPEDTK